MSTVGEREVKTQKRVVDYFRNTLGYSYLGFWKDRDGNSNFEENQLGDWLKKCGYAEKIVGKAIHELGKARALGGSKTLYDANREVYGLLRYGVKIKPDVGKQNTTVWLIDWKNPAKNHFAIAEEVTIAGSDYPAIQGFILYATTMYVLLFLITDIIYRILDPRIGTT
jgi:type I restriction enzyme, R subunit